MYMKTLKVGVILLSSIVMLTMFSCGADRPGSAAAGPSAKEYPVRKLEFANIVTNNRFPASIEGIQTVELRPRVEGYLEEIYVDEGAMVKKGQALFKINSDEFTQQVNSAKANVAVAEARVNTAKMEVEKQRPLVKKGIVSEYVLTSAEYALQSAEAELKQAEASLENARTNLSYTIVRSPTDGTIGTIPYRIGSLVSSNISEPLTLISDINQVRAYFALNEKDYLTLSKTVLDPVIHGKAGRKESVSLILANGIPFENKGTIDAVSGIISQNTGSVTIRATFENPQGLLRSGSSATIMVPNALDSVLIVPQSATYEIQNKRFIYVSDEAGTVNTREINVVPDDTGKQFIVFSGLSAGELVVVEGINSLKSGSQVKIVPEVQ